MRFLLSTLVILGFLGARAQYWIGPKVGLQRTDFIYHDEDYKQDLFNVRADYGFHAGAVVIYQATDRYAVKGEILWERLTKVVSEKEDSDIPVFSKSNYNYLSIPFSLRWNFGSQPVHFYVGGGPKISYFLGGTGVLDLDEFDEASGEPKDYRFVFRQSKSNGTTRLAIPSANRFQYALVANAGCFLDLRGGTRLSVDFRYSFGHSNVGFNDNPDFNEFVSYSENFRYRQNIFSISIAYLLEYDVQLQRKGASTNKLSNKSKKKRRRVKKDN